MINKKVPMKHLKYLILLPLLLVNLYVIRNTSQLFMPYEYKTIKKIVSKIAANNSVGDEPIIFSVTPGRDIENDAKGLDLCDNGSCQYFSNLDPFKRHNDIKGFDINNLIKKSALNKKIEVYSINNKNIKISKSSFDYLNKSVDKLACEIARELVNTLVIDPKTNISGKPIKLDFNKKINNKDSVYDRAIIFAHNAGYDMNQCFKSFVTYKFNNELFNFKSNTDSNLNQNPLDIQKVENLIDQDSFSGKNLEVVNKWKWIYNRELNILKFVPS
tara:strand:+ start:526 stop:1344 length:819 start_codon:yes stop_codon:yes gene_type:complete